jgi:hypothetical protein
MSAGELWWRVKYRAFLAFEAGRHRRGQLVKLDRLRGRLRPEVNAADPITSILELRNAAQVKFFRGLDQPARTQRLFRSGYLPERDLAKRQADAALRHEFEFFGSRFQYSDTIDWHADPPTGRRWPVKYHADVLVHRGDTGYGDVKYVWELNRHQFLIDLGKARFLFSDERASRELFELVRDWMAQNPYGTGVSWTCALEPAFRVWSWLWAYNFTRAAGELDADSHLEWLAGFSDHGHFLHRHLEYYSSPYNHLIGEASALYALGVLFPEFREAAAWRRRGREVLESRLSSQFHADGGSVEQSTFYHHATLGFYLLAGLLGRANNENLSPAVWYAIERATEFSMQIMQPDGTLPRIGGADDGKPIRLQHLPFWDFRPYQAIGAVVFNRPDFKYAAGRFTEDALWLLGPDALDVFNQLPSEPPRDVATALTRSGYFVMRSDWTPRADYVCFDCGEQAAGARRDNVRSAMHGHADCLSVIVWLGGEPVLVDPGFYCYNGDPDWEVHFRKTGAHNTARIDGRDQAKHVRKMDWCDTFMPRLERWQTDPRQAMVAGSHDGYARGPNGVTHRRLVWRRPSGYIVLVDEFEGSGTHGIDLTYQFAPGGARLDGQSLVFRDMFELVWETSAGVRAQLWHGGERPEHGWIAPSLGIRLPAPRLDLRVRFSAPRTVVLSVLADLRVTNGRRRVQKGGQSARSHVLSVEGVSHIDRVTASEAAGALAPGCDADGEYRHAGHTLLHIDSESIAETVRKELIRHHSAISEF